MRRMGACQGGRNIRFGGPQLSFQAVQATGTFGIVTPVEHSNLDGLRLLEASSGSLKGRVSASHRVFAGIAKIPG